MNEHKDWKPSPARASMMAAHLKQRMDLANAAGEDLKLNYPSFSDAEKNPITIKVTPIPYTGDELSPNHPTIEPVTDEVFLMGSLPTIQVLKDKVIFESNLSKNDQEHIKKFLDKTDHPFIKIMVIVDGKYAALQSLSADAEQLPEYLDRDFYLDWVK